MTERVEAPPDKSEDSKHREAATFVEKHRDLFENYARGEIEVKPAPAGLNTFAFNLNSNEIYVNSRFYTERGFSDEKTAWATCHEIEHFLEKKATLAEENGEAVFEAYVKRIGEDKAFGILDNCVADVRENKAVARRTNESFRKIEVDLYRHELFPRRDFTQEPKHLQFSYAILCGERDADAPCTVHPEVRKRLDALGAIKSDAGKLLDVMTDPQMPMSKRLELQDHFIVPLMKELLEQDMQEAAAKSDKDDDKKEKSDDSGGKGRPEEVFKEAYERAEKRMPQAVPLDEVKKEFEKWKEAEGSKSLEKADKKYADSLGVSVEDLRNHRKLDLELEAIVNPKTGESVVRDLERLIERIITRRIKLVDAPRYPVEDGEDLVDPAALVAGVRAGNLEPKAWETTASKEITAPATGEVEITLVFDRSGSMNGTKLAEQQKAGVLFMNTLEKLAKRCNEDRNSMDPPLLVRSEAYSFQSSDQDSVPLKPLSEGFDEATRVKIAATLGTTPKNATTTDFVPLNAITKSLTEETFGKIERGELKKIVIVFTDGGSNDPGAVQQVAKTLRGKGVVVVGVGITDEGRPALTTYAPDAKLARRAEDLPVVLGELLKEHLAAI